LAQLLSQAGAAGSRQVAAARRQLHAPGRTHRRTWVGNGRAHIEVRAVHRRDGQPLARQVERDLEALEGVDWAEVNAVLGRVVVAFDEDATTLDDLVATVETAEEAHGVQEERYPRDRPPHPGDSEPLVRNITAMGADTLGLGVSVFGQLLRATPIPGELASVIALADSQPRVRRLLESRLGPPATDLGLALASAIAQALGQGPLGLLVDIGHRANAVGEIRSRQRTWAGREPELTAQHGRWQIRPIEAAETGRRPAPMPRGPVERHADRATLAAFGVFGLSLAATSDPRRAANTLMAAAPKAARLGREAFAAQMGRDLANRDVVVLDPSALRRLDRIDTVVVDRSAILSGPTLDPLAEAFVARVRDAGCTLIVTGVDQQTVLDLGADRSMPGGSELAESVRTLQREGHVVACVSTGGDAALRAADCGIGLSVQSAPPPWGADLVCGVGLEPACRVVEACGGARQASRRSSMLAAGGSAIGGIGALIGPGRGAAQRGLLPVNAAAILAEAVSTWSAAELARRPRPLPSNLPDWHAMEIDEALAVLDTSRAGLSAAAARRRNASSAAAAEGASGPSSLASALLAELANPLTPLLTLGAGLSAAVGSIMDAALVGGVVAINAGISAAQRLRTERSLEELTRTTAVKANVCRGGQFLEIPADRLVVGDLVRVAQGEVVPADCRMLEAGWCEVDESSLTGESLPVAKDPEPVPGAAVGERTSMLYAGTTVVAGGALAVVVATGTATEAGRGAAGVGEPPPSGVEDRLRALTNATLPVTLLSGAAVGAMGVFRRLPLREAVGSGVSLMVAAVPEGLPLLATVAQQSAAHRLSDHQALVRNPRTIEALGRVDLLCFDKTGTLTEGRIGLQRVSDGTVDESVDDLGPGRRAVLAAALRASPSAENGEVLTHATDRAVVEGATAQDVTPADGLGGWEPKGELAFEPGRGFHAVAGRSADGGRLAIKGAPEAVLARCNSHRGSDGRSRRLDRGGRRRLDAEVERLAQQGLRVLAVGERHWNETAELEDGDLRDFELLGFVALADLVRSTAADAVRALRRAGVEVAMITGDHPSTAEAIAAELGILNGGSVLTGPDLDALDDAALDEAVADVTVFARVTPSHKVRIVAAYQRAGRVVAMTGDGANDAPAIRLAHAGVALGRRGTPAARAAADLVVTDDRIETIIDAIVEGRAMWASVRDALAILVGGNLGEVAFTLAGTVISGRSPLSARQLLLVNLLTDMVPAMAIALQPPATTSPEALLHEGPEASLGGALARQIALRAATTAGGATAAWLVASGTGRPARARTVGLVAVVGTQMGQTIVAGRRSPAVIASALASAGLLVPIVQIPPVSRFFGCTPLGPAGWATAIGSASAATSLSIAVPWIASRLRGGSSHPASGKLELEVRDGDHDGDKERVGSREAQRRQPSPQGTTEPTERAHPRRDSRDGVRPAGRGRQREGARGGGGRRPVVASPHSGGRRHDDPGAP
jgi:cation-transporting ATPase I